MTKQELRKLIKEKKSTIKTKEESLRICKSIINSKEFTKAEAIFLYMALPDEVDLSFVMQEAFLKNKKVAVPVCLTAPEMKFCMIESLSDLKPGSFGIMEPSNYETKSEAFTQVEDQEVLLLVPGRAFTKDGKRLGRGKGFYDWYLSRYKKNRVHAAGVCFPEQILKSIPTDEHDIKVDSVFY